MLPVTVAQAQLGHADSRTTLGIYAHAIGDSQRNAVEKPAKLLDPSGPQQKSISTWVQKDRWGERWDSNPRPSGPRPQNGLARLCLPITYVHGVRWFSTLFKRILFPLCSPSCSGSDCRGSLYLDDGKTYAYSRGDYLRVDYSCQPATDSLAITISRHKGSYQAWWKQVHLEVLGVEKAPKELRAEGHSLAEWAYSSERHAVTFTLPESSSGWTILLLY